MVAEKTPTTAITPFEPASLEQAMTLSKTLSTSALLPEPLRGKPQDVLAIMMTGHELGLSPMQSIRSISIIKGKPVLDAALIVGLCLRSKDVCEYFTLAESSDKSATYEAKRAGCPKPTTLSYTIEQAKAAGLTGKDNWRNHPAAMLRARCSSALARAIFPDLVAGLYEPDEGEEMRPHPRSSSPAPLKVVETPAAPKPPPPTAPESDVVEGQIVATATTASGRTIRIVDECPDRPEPPPPADSEAPAAARVEDGPSLFDELLGELSACGYDPKALGEWIERCRAAEKRKGISADEMVRLKAAYKAHLAAKKGGAA